MTGHANRLLAGTAPHTECADYAGFSREKSCTGRLAGACESFSRAALARNVVTFRWNLCFRGGFCHATNSDVSCGVVDGVAAAGRFGLGRLAAVLSSESLLRLLLRKLLLRRVQLKGCGSCCCQTSCCERRSCCQQTSCCQPTSCCQQRAVASRQPAANESSDGPTKKPMMAPEAPKPLPPAK